MTRARAIWVLVATSFAATGAPLRAQSDNDAVRDSVVKIYSIRRSRSLTNPWKRGTSSNLTGSGVVISPNQVLTNYHVVAATTDISISLNGQSERVSGSVQAIAPGIDLAVIALDEPLPEKAKPLEIAAVTPKPGSKIQVFGYPKGGESLSVTEGVISRIEHVRYRYHTAGLRAQIDAPLNDGNSGGPMIFEQKVVGIAFSGLSASNDIGYAIPCEEIATMLEDTKDGTYDGKPRLWWRTQTLASKQMRRWLKMPDDASGLKFAVMPIPIDDYPLKMNDIITHIGSYKVNNLGKVGFDENTQVSYGYAVDQAADTKLVGEKVVADAMVPVKIFRDGEEMDIQVPAFRDGHYLLDYMLDTAPNYFVHGPIVFGVAVAEFPASFDTLLARGGTSARAASSLLGIMQQYNNPYLVRRYDRVKNTDEQLVVITKLISNRMTRDIKVIFPAVIRTINGQSVPNIRAAAELIDSLEDELLVIEFEDNRNTTIVLSRNDIEREHDQIMENNGIVNAASKNLRDVWRR
jgi:S1-C subfamily serine protease